MMPATERAATGTSAVSARGGGAGEPWRRGERSAAARTTDLRVAVVIGALLVACVWIEPGPATRAGFCPVRLLTGWRCPGCGMGHALAAAAKGRIGVSWTAHPLGLPALGMLVLVWLRAGLRIAWRRPGWLALPRRASRGFAAVGLVLVVLLWAVRLAGLG